MCIRDRFVFVRRQTGWKRTALLLATAVPVSYTHLDVYKRQTMWKDGCICDRMELDS